MEKDKMNFIAPTSDPAKDESTIKWTDELYPEGQKQISLRFPVSEYEKMQNGMAFTNMGITEFVREALKFYVHAIELQHNNGKPLPDRNQVSRKPTSY